MSLTKSRGGGDGATEKSHSPPPGRLFSWLPCAPSRPSRAKLRAVSDPQDPETPSEPAAASAADLLEDADFDDVPEPVLELLAVCRQYVLARVGIELDFTPETLPVLDHYVELSRPELEDRPEALALVARAVGAYFGEVVRRQLDGMWRVPGVDDHQWAVCARPVFLALNPVGAAYDALHTSDAHEGPSSELRLLPDERELVERRLGDLPPVSEREYYLLSTRLEAAEIAFEALRAEQSRTGRADVRFDESDYATELEPLQD